MAEKFSKGDLVSMPEAQLGVIVGTEGDSEVPEGHVAVWFGTATPQGAHEVWTVPHEYVTRAGGAVVRH